MAVPEQMPIVAYIANGTTFSFPITFDLHDDRYLDVLINKELVKSTSYTIENNSAVVFGTAPRSGDEIILARSTTLDRQTNFDSYNNSFRPSALNWDLDKIWHTLQEQYVVDANFLARLKNELETRRTSDSLLQHQIDILNSVLLGVFENASSTYLEVKLQELEDSLDNAINIAAAAGAGANGWTDLLIQTADGRTQRELNEISVKNGDFGTVLNTTVELAVNTSKPSFRFGLKGDGAFDDSNNNFRGLPNPTEPWSDENTGIGSTMFGRDNATYAYLSMANGHGCSNFGVASFAGGAGTGTGNPDTPNDGATYGYCSLAYGKDTSAIGRISTAFGQSCKASSIHSFSAGIESKSGAGLATHPNALGGNGVVSDGDCAFSYGYRAYAYGDYSFALGSFVTAYNGSQVIGRGINPGSRLENALPRSLAMGYGVDIPTIIMTDSGINGGFGKLGINTTNPRERVEINLKTDDKIAIRTNSGGASIDLQGTLGDGSSASITRIEYTSENGGQAYGQLNLYQNGSQFLNVNQSGDVNIKKLLKLDTYLMIGGQKIIGSQQSAIADSTSTAADNARAINAILAALRSHGLIAT